MRHLLAVLPVMGVLLAACAQPAPAGQPTGTTPAPTASLAPVPGASASPLAAPSSPLAAPSSPLAAPAATAAGNALPGGQDAPLVALATAGLARRLQVDPAALRLRSITAVEWPDACLGAAQLDEMCAQMITPGFRLIFSTPDGDYLVRTNQDGRALRYSPLAATTPEPGALPGQQPTTAPGAPVSAAAAPAVAAGRAALATQLAVAAADVQLVRYEAVTWSDGCLGVGAPNESCLQALTPGYRMVFSTAQGIYEVHTNNTGTAVRLAPPAH